MAEVKDQRHPQYTKDRQIINELLAQTTPSNRDYAELARLSIRYKGFVGARDIQSDLLKILHNWQLTEETLFEQTRQLYATGQAYQPKKGDEPEDWS